MTIDEKFLSLADIASPLYDKQSAKDFAMVHYAEFTEQTKFLFHHAFPDVAQKAFPITRREPQFVTAGFYNAEKSYW